MKTVAIIQARTTSTRLPNKVLKDLSGKPLLTRVIERITAAKKVDDVVLAIPDNEANLPLEKYAKENSFNLYKGSEENVLDRYYQAAKGFGADIVLRLTSDNPLIDPELIDKVVEHHLASGADYTDNHMNKTWPEGMRVEVINFDALEKAHKNAKDEFEKEHVTPYIYHTHPELFKIQDYPCPPELRRPNYRLTVDTPEDFELISKIYEHFRDNLNFSYKDVVKYLDANPDLPKINVHIKQKGLKDK